MTKFWNKLHLELETSIVNEVIIISGRIVDAVASVVGEFTKIALEINKLKITAVSRNLFHFHFSDYQ